MLSIGKIALGQHRYYEQQVAGGGDDYYSGRGEAPGQWVGGGAEALGLTGMVGADQFSALIAGLDPREPSVRLRSSERDPKIAAFDLTFSAPKSVSVLFAVAPEHVSGELIGCHEEAVAAALSYLEETAVMVRRGHGGHDVEPAEGLVAAAYRHRMSRALDPQLHTHVVAANLACGPDGRFTALHSSLLYTAAKTTGTLYQAHLRALVTERLGLEWGEVRKGAAELAQIDPAVLEHFSKRRAEMQREAEAGGIGLGSKGAAESAALATRDRKRYGLDTHTWREEVRARAGEMGLDASEIELLLGAGSERIATGGAQRGGVQEQGFGDLLAGASGLTERANVFDERLVLQQFAGAARAGALVAEVRGQAQRFTERADVVPTAHGEMTTAELIACERRLIAAATGRAGEGTARLDEKLVERLASVVKRPLSGEQREAVCAVIGSGDGVSVIQALAGTGKTYTAGALREAYEAAGYEVLGAAPTGRAARELCEQAGVPARTIDRLLIDLEVFGERLPARCVLILDEAGMAPTRLSGRMLRLAEQAGAKVVAIGDPGQLASVRAGGWLAAVSDRLGVVSLREVMRQRDPAERRALAELHDHRPRHYIEWAEQRGRIEIFESPQEACEQALRQWSSRLEGGGSAEVVMIARENETRDALNQAAREQREQAGELTGGRAYGTIELAIGDRVICRQNDTALDVDNGTRGTVIALDADTVSVRADGGAIRRLPAAYAVEHVEHAYALTGHAMQGGTVRDAIVLASPHELTAGWSYTALSRARDTTRLLVYDEHEKDRREFAPADRTPAATRQDVLARIARRMLDRDDEDLAIEQLPAKNRQPRSSVEQDREPGAPRERVERLSAQLAALPAGKLRRIEDLERREQTLAGQREQTTGLLAELPEPRRRLGREHDPHAVQRAHLTSALQALERGLQATRGERESIQAEVGEPAALQRERQSLQDDLERLTREHPELDQQREQDQVAQREHGPGIEIEL